VHKYSTRIGDYWLVLTHLEGSSWRLQVWGDEPLEAEVIAEDETEAKRSAAAATIERLQIQRTSSKTNWNSVITSRWDSRLCSGRL